MKKRLFMLFILVAAAAWFFPAGAETEAATPTPIPSPTPIPVIVEAIYASYTGGSVSIGDTISEEDISVTAWMSDGSMEEITEYVLSSRKVLLDGVNTFTVVYKGKMATFIVYGRKAQQISAAYYGGTISVGNSVGRENISVSVYFSDGSYENVEDYILSNHIINTVGTQKVQVNYGGLNTSFDVIGIAAKPVVALYVDYHGSEVIQGNKIPEKDIVVTATYSDGSAERIYNYVVSPEIITEVGGNQVLVSYHGQTEIISVDCVVKTLMGMKAEYNGETVEVGRYVDPVDIKVTASFDDGSEEEVTDYSLLGSKISVVGNNTVIVVYNGKRSEIVVRGTPRTAPNYDYAASFTVKNDKKKQATVKIALPKMLSTDVLTGRSLKSSTISGLLGKAWSDDAEYIAFDIILQDETKDNIFPLTMKIKLPSSFKMEYTSVYYTPNRKTIAGQMDAEILSKTELEVTFYYSGTYILVYQVPKDTYDDIYDTEKDYLD